MRRRARVVAETLRARFEGDHTRVEHEKAMIMVGVEEYATLESRKH